MTREIIRQIERDYWAEKADPIDMSEIFDLAQKALEQEPILDKIRAEIVDLGKRTMNDNRASGIWACRDIIDKYKAESEVENGNN